MKKATNAMPERPQSGSISRTLVLPREHHLGIGTLGTFRLRYILAEDGCKESQVTLAKSLLTAPASDLNERTFNAQLAVYWLLQAAKNGQEEAFIILKECSSAGVGINAINNSEVEECLKFSDDEKLSRRVAFSLFRAIMSDTEDVVPEDIFREKIDLIFKEENREITSTMLSEEPLVQLQQQPPLKKHDEKSLRNQAHVSFSEVVNSFQSCLEGNVPLVSLKQVTHYTEYKRWLSTKYIHMVWDLILRATEKFVQHFSSVVLPLSCLFLCIYLQIYAFLFPSGNEASHFMKTSMFLLILFCLVFMVSLSCFIVHINFGGDNLKKWLHLIKVFEPNIKPDSIEKKFLSKTAFPLFTFFLISFLYVVLVPLNPDILLFSDIGILGTVLMFFIDRTIAHQRYYVNISLILNILTCLYKANILQQILANSLSFFNFNITYEVMENVHLHLSFISCLALPFVLPFLYIKMALGKQRGWQLVLLPHLMSLTWMNLAFIHLTNTTITYQLFSLFSLLVILVLSKYLGIILTFILYVLYKAAVADYFRMDILIFSLLFIIIYIASSFFVKKYKLSIESPLFSTVLCLVTLILSYHVIKSQIPYSDKTSQGILPWEKYQTYCHHNAWYRTNTAEVQISCLPLKGREISMEGTITGIDVIEVKNNMKLIANVLPEPLQSWFSCGFGKNFQNCNSEVLTQFEKERCKLYESLNLNQCHMYNWDEYKYQLVLEVSTRTSPEVVLFANNVCSEFVRNLKEGDSIKAIAALESNIGSLSPRFILKQAKCTNCYTDAVCNTDTVTDLSLPDYRLSFKNIVWVYFAPFIQYEPK